MTINEEMERAFSGEMYTSGGRPMRDAFVLATEVKRLQDLHRPRDTRQGEWPEEGQDIHVWRHQEWEAHAYHSQFSMPSDIWLPAPPSPEDKA